VGDVVLVKPGASVPADGVVLQGQSRVNESLVTGESAEVTKVEGDRVIAGTINASGRSKSIGALTVQVSAIGGDTMISGIMRLVADAQASKSRGQILADRAAGWLFYFALISAALTAALWTVIGTHDLTWTVERVVTVLVIACPHALGLAIPLVTAITTERAAKAGIIIRNRLDFEKARSVKMVMFDKTGTLTTGKRSLVASHLTIGSPVASTEDLIRLAAAVEKNSEHIIGSAILAEANRLQLAELKAESFQAQPGIGVSAMIKGRLVEVGSPALLVDRQGDIDVRDLVKVQAANDSGNTVIFVVVDHALAGYFEFGDEVRESSLTAVRELQRRGIRVGMVTGDAHGVATALAEKLGITDVYAEVLPGQKSELVKQKQAEGFTVAFVGDGINDAPALAQADVALAIASGTDVAFETSGLVLVNSDPKSIVEAIDLSKRSVAKMRQNLFWGAGYNIVAVPLAAGLFSTFGVELSPAVGAVLMSLSTIIVAANAQLLRR
jgi:Cu2+-exporting ATPase